MPPRKKKEVVTAPVEKEEPVKTRLTRGEANQLLEDVQKGLVTNASLRFGQALWNMMANKYPTVAGQYHGTLRDFFYWNNAGDVLRTFNEYYVEQ